MSEERPLLPPLGPYNDRDPLPRAYGMGLLRHLIPFIQGLQYSLIFENLILLPFVLRSGSKLDVFGVRGSAGASRHSPTANCQSAVGGMTLLLATGQSNRGFLTEFYRDEFASDIIKTFAFHFERTSTHPTTTLVRPVGALTITPRVKYHLPSMF